MQRIIFTLIIGLALSGCGDKQASTAPDAPQKTTLQTAEAANGTHPGKTLLEENCMSCHDSGVYTRPDRKMTDFAMLSTQVRRCDANLGSKLFDEDMDSITNYLNETYYKFPKP